MMVVLKSYHEWLLMTNTVLGIRSKLQCVRAYRIFNIEEYTIILNIAYKSFSRTSDPFPSICINHPYLFDGQLYSRHSADRECRNRSLTPSMFSTKCGVLERKKVDRSGYGCKLQVHSIHRENSKEMCTLTL